MRRSFELSTGRWYRRAEWDKCNICGKSFPNWPKLWDHKRQHTEEEINRSLKIRPAGRARTAKQS